MSTTYRLLERAGAEVDEEQRDLEVDLLHVCVGIYILIIMLESKANNK